MTAPAPPSQLPDDIEQKLLDGQRLRATHDLMERRGITLNEARELVGRWMFDRQQPNAGRNHRRAVKSKILIYAPITFWAL